jgi:hypothetical protein
MRWEVCGDYTRVGHAANRRQYHIESCGCGKSFTAFMRDKHDEESSIMLRAFDDLDSAMKFCASVETVIVTGA